ncbi:MAG: hypothetical protein HQK75_19215 [Candidatus Magnetomorum sp.]|nr:hypothetical protein [Candidatus Magnetomorum sp.]
MKMITTINKTILIMCFGLCFISGMSTQSEAEQKIERTIISSNCIYSKIIISLAKDTNDTCCLIEEKLISGVLPMNISHNGFWHEATRTIRWDAFFDNQELSYELKQMLLPGPHDVSGRFSMDGSVNLISGNNQLYGHITISGFVLDPLNHPISGVNLFFNNDAGTTLTNDQGYYSHPVCTNIVSLMAYCEGRGYFYTPILKYFTDLSNNLYNENYTGNRFTISGQCLDQNDIPISGVQLTIIPGNKVFYSDDDGYYHYNFDYQASISIVAEKSGYAFEPDKKMFQNISQNYANQRFTGKERVYHIYGNIIDQDQQPLVKAQLCLAEVCIETDSNGHYNLPVPFLSDGVITPEKQGYLFYPKNLAYGPITTDQTGQSYTAVILNYLLAGTIIDKDNHLPVPDVTLTIGDKTIQTDAAGQFNCETVFGFTGKILPQKTGYTFDPSEIMIDRLSQNITLIKISAQKKQVTISGTVKDNNNTLIQENVYIQFSRLGRTQTNAQGEYTFLVPYDWSGKAEIFVQNHVVLPPNLMFEAVTHDIPGQNLVAYPNTTAGTILVTPDIATVSHSGEEIALTVQITPENLSWAVETQESWLTVNRQTNALIVQVHENTGISPRTGNIHITAKNATNSPVNIHIYQMAPPITHPCRPTWETDFDPSEYQYYQTLTAIVTDDQGQALDHVDDLLAAFSTNDIRGVAHPIDTVSGRRYFLQIWSPNPYEEDISFKHYDAQACRIHDSIKYPLDFQANASLGNIIEPHVLSISDYYLRLALNKYWNWITINVRNTDMSVESVLAALENKGIIIIGQEGYAEYMPTDSQWAGTLKQLNPLAMYIIKINEPGILEYFGTDMAVDTIRLKKGWNWTGYLPAEDIPVNIALASLGENALKISGQHGFSEYLQGYGWYGSLQTLKPGRGYMIKMAIEAYLTYPETAGRSKRTRRLDRNLVPGQINDTVFDASQFENQATVTAHIIFEEKDTTDPNSALLAFSGEECRGIARPESTPEGYRYFLQIWSNEALEKISFKYYHAPDKHVYPIEKTILFSANQTHGSIHIPEEMLIGQQTSIWQVHSQEFKNQGTIVANIPTDDTWTIHENDKLAVCINEECRGVTGPSDTPFGTRFFVQIWGDEAVKMNYHYWHYETNQIDTIYQPLMYTPHMESGTIENPVNLDIEGDHSDKIQTLIVQISHLEESLTEVNQLLDGSEKNLEVSRNQLSNTQHELTLNKIALDHANQSISDLTDEISGLNHTIQAFNVQITDLSSYTVDLTAGWYLMSGPLDREVFPVTEPGGCIKAMYIFEDGAYELVYSLLPKKGVWVNVDQTCKIRVGPN